MFFTNVHQPSESTFPRAAVLHVFRSEHIMPHHKINSFYRSSHLHRICNGTGRTGKCGHWKKDLVKQ